MPFPSFPVEIWFQIMDRACQDDGTTGLALSGTSKELRILSELHRYQSVQINGWRQLLAFERQLSQVPKAQRAVLNLFVYLPSAFDAGYPGVPKWAPDEDSEEDPSYVPSDDSESEEESDGEEDGDGDEDEGGVEGGCAEAIHEAQGGPSDDSEPEEVDEDVKDPTSDVASDTWDEEDELEYSPLPDADRILLLMENAVNLQGDRRSLVPEVSIFENCEKDARQTYEAERNIFAALTRLLRTCCQSLQIFTLSWDPFFTFKIGQVIPVLPKLKSLSVWMCGQPNPELESLASWDHRPPHQPSDKTALFPSLERLELSNPFCGFWLEYLPIQNLKLKYATVPCTSVLRILNARPIRIRILCNCRTCMPVPPSPTVFRAKFVDFRQNWIDQVLQCTMFPGYEPRPIGSSPTFQQLIKEQFDEMLMELVSKGRLRLVDKSVPGEEAAESSEETIAPEEPPPAPVPVMMIIWSEDDSPYHDLLLITGEDGCVRLADQRSQLTARGVDCDAELEVYDPLNECWSPTPWSQALGPFEGAGGTVLLRRTGVTKLNHFNTFLPLARSLKKGKTRASDPTGHP